MLQLAIGFGGMTFASLFIVSCVTLMAKDAKTFSWRKKNIAQLWRDITAIALALCALLSSLHTFTDAIMRIVLK